MVTEEIFNDADRKQIVDIASGEADLDLDTPLYEKLFEYFLSTNEMPYGVAKARTGDPDFWIAEKLSMLQLKNDLERVLHAKQVKR